jgi:hypothetical protein
MKRNDLKKMYYKETSDYYKDKDGNITKQYLNWVEDNYIKLITILDENRNKTS